MAYLLQAWLLVVGGVGSVVAETDVKPKLEYAVVVTGGEILDGLYADSHTHYLGRTLRPHGGRCVLSMTVDDRARDLMKALQFAVNHASLVFVTGGLGPTPNDITRETISDFTGIPLREREEVVAGMERRFNLSRSDLRPNLRRQALVPESGDFLQNSAGTAVGLIFHTTNATIVALPGPPRELQPMVEQQLLPYLQERYGLRRVGLSLMLRFVGLGQSQISQVLQDQVRLPPELVITSHFEAGRVDFTFTLPGETEVERGWLKELGETMQKQLGANIYAEDERTLEEKVVELFDRQKLTLALVEMGTGGHLTDSLSDVQVVERVLVGSFVAPSQRRMLQLLQMKEEAGAGDWLGRVASEVRKRLQSDAVLVLACPTRAEDPKVARALLMWAEGDQQQVEFPWTDSRPGSLDLLTTRVLDWLRGNARAETANE